MLPLTSQGNKIIFFQIATWFAVTLFSSGSLWAQQQSDVIQKRIRILTASEQGEYYKSGVALKSLLTDEYSVFVTTTSGSYANIERLGSGRAELAFVQADALYLYIMAGNWIANQCLAIAPLSPEYIHIIVRRDSTVKKLTDLQKAKISTGTKYSGSWVSASLILLSELKIKTTDNPNIVHLPTPASVDKLLKKEIDAIFITTAKGAPLIKDLLFKNESLTILSFPGDFSFHDRIIDRYYSIEPLHTGTYPNLEKLIYIPAVQSYLLAYKNLDKKVVKQITSRIYSSKKELANESPLWEAMSIFHAKQKMKQHIPFHEGAKGYILYH